MSDTSTMQQAPIFQSRAEPSLRDALDVVKKEVLLSLNCHAIATIQSFDPVLQTAKVTINYKKTFLQKDPKTGVYGPVLVDYPVIFDCPVFILQGGNAALTFPIQPGDTCDLHFNDRDIDNWFTSGTVGGPVATGRLHAFADAIAYIGRRSLKNPLPNYDSTRASLWNGTTRVAVNTDKVLIENSSYRLNALLQELISDVKDLVTATAAITVLSAAPGSPTGLPVNIADITAVSAKLSTLATKIGGLLE
jgi:hypothetical protein